MALSLELSVILRWNFAYTLLLASSSLRNWPRLCRATNSEKVLWPFAKKKLVNHLEYFNKRSHSHWYWQELAQEIAKWYLSSVEELPSSKFQKVKWPYFLNWVEYCNEILHTHSSVEFLPSVWVSDWKLCSEGHCSASKGFFYDYMYYLDDRQQCTYYVLNNFKTKSVSHCASILPWNRFRLPSNLLLTVQGQWVCCGWLSLSILSASLSVISWLFVCFV